MSNRRDVWPIIYVNPSMGALKFGIEQFPTRSKVRFWEGRLDYFYRSGLAHSIGLRAADSISELADRFPIFLEKISIFYVFVPDSPEGRLAGPAIRASVTLIERVSQKKTRVGVNQRLTCLGDSMEMESDFAIIRLLTAKVADAIALEVEKINVQRQSQQVRS